MFSFMTRGASKKDSVIRLIAATILFAGLLVLIQLRKSQDEDHFNQAAFASNLMDWINSQVDEEGGKIKAVHVLERRKQDSQGSPMFFTRVALEPVKGGLANVSYLTDNSGRIVFNSVIDLEKHVDIALLARIKAQPKAALPPDAGVVIFAGDGPHQVVMFTDFFCGHCEKAEKWLMDNAIPLGIGRLELVPAPMHPFSEQVLDNLLARPKESRQAYYLESIRGLAGRKLDQKMIDDLFPKVDTLEPDALRERATLEKLMKDFNVRGTPQLFVDGLPLLPGFNQTIVSAMLSR